MPRVGHFGLVPRHPTWIGGLRAYCKTVEEALRLYQGVNPLELAGAFAVETECVPAEVQTETSRRTGPIAFPIGLGSSGDVRFVFMEDICGENETPPRHAKAHTTLRNMGAGIDDPAAHVSRSLAETDPSVRAALDSETARQCAQIELIVSENIMSRAVREALGHEIGNKTPEGYPRNCFPGGGEYVDVVERLAIERAKKLFGAACANVQGSLHSNVLAAKAVCLDEALRPEFKVCGQRVVENAQTPAATLADRGIGIGGGGTDTQMAPPRGGTEPGLASGRRMVSGRRVRTRRRAGLGRVDG